MLANIFFSLLWILGILFLLLLIVAVIQGIFTTIDKKEDKKQ
jgi:quinol-cytochrome oxidoreductase complex cytochrome b subunit